MNNVGVPLSDNSQYERPPIAAMFNVPYTYRCDMRREFVKRWCNSNTDIICYVTKVSLCNHTSVECKFLNANFYFFQPTEKQISMYYMNITCLTSITLTVLDFVTASYKFMGSKYKKFKTYREKFR